MESALVNFVHQFGSGDLLLDREADWSKVRSIDFREAFNEREALKPELDTFDVFDDQFEHDYETLHGQRVLEEKIAL